MNRRASLPGADELFRSTDARERDRDPARVRPLREAARPEPPRPAGSGSTHAAPEPAVAVDGASGRVQHDQKITVYLTSQELLDLEQARLRLRAEFDIAVDRGRIVREAIAELLLDLHERGPDSDLVRRLT